MAEERRCGILENVREATVSAIRGAGDERHREEARRYAALLRLDRRRFPALYRRRRPHIL